MLAFHGWPIWLHCSVWFCPHHNRKKQHISRWELWTWSREGRGYCIFAIMFSFSPTSLHPPLLFPCSNNIWKTLLVFLCVCVHCRYESGLTFCLLFPSGAVKSTQSTLWIQPKIHRDYSLPLQALSLPWRSAWMLQNSLHFIVHQCIWGWHGNKTFSCAFHLHIFMFPTGTILLNGLIFIAAGKCNSAAKSTHGCCQLRTS